MKIAVLSQDVINQIAAGEVVERPSHLVKELIENSLDAKSTKIEVEFSNGGRTVRVSDNGSGISAGDLALALERHATSKIVASEDLFALHSYGFRGEALASIAAVSKLSLISKRGDQAYQVENEFGKVSDVVEVGGNPGTTIFVRELFANMPARLKFLKSEVAESTQIKQTLKAFALIHPEIELRVKSEKPIFTFKAQKSMLARAKEVLNTTEVYESESQLGSAHARVLFCSPNIVTGNSKGIWLFVQKRWVQDRTMQAAVLEAYRGLLMHGEFPNVIVDLSVDPAEVDVNIHPTKSNVKFRDNSAIFRVVQRALRQGLELAPWIDAKASIQYEQKVQPTFIQEKMSGPEELEQVRLRQKVSEPLAAYFTRDPAPRENDLKEPNPFSTRTSSPASGAGLSSGAVSSAAKTAATTGDTKETPKSLSEAPTSQKKYWSNLQVLGQAQQTYILSQNSQGLVIVDQHAAHERINYERLMQSWNEKKFEIQDFLFPLSFQLDPNLIEALLSHREDLESLGFLVEAMGPEHIAVRSAPAILKESAIQKSITELANEIADKGGSFAIDKCIMHIFATMACHSSVRAGQALATEEMKALLTQMDDFALSSFCPHGRPVSVEYPFHKLERDFGRIN